MLFGIGKVLSTRKNNNRFGIGKIIERCTF